MIIHPLWYLCLSVRLSLAVFIWFQNSGRLRIIMSVLLLLIGLGFFRKYVTGSNNEVQISKVFWHETRIVHGFLYTLSSVLLFIRYPKLASIAILIDIIFSISYRIKTNK